MFVQAGDRAGRKRHSAMKAGQITVGQGVFSNSKVVTISGDATLASTGTLTVVSYGGTVFGTMAAQNATSVNIDGGTIDATAIGGVTPAAGSFTTVNVAAGQAYEYNGLPIVTALTSISSYFFGGAGNLTMTGTFNIGVGLLALNANTTGQFNVGLGASALLNNTTGGFNFGCGTSALKANISGSFNVAVGMQSLTTSISGSNNVGNGYWSLTDSMSSSNNVAIGSNSLQNLGTVQTAGAFVGGISYTIQTIGTTDFTLIGAASNTVGLVFTASGVGTGTGTASPNANANVAIGNGAGASILTGSNNTIIGANYHGSGNQTGTIVLATGDGTVRADYNNTTASTWTLSAPMTNKTFTVSTLPAAGVAGRMAFATNCRMFNGLGVQELAGAGTGGLVTDNGTAWKIAGTNVTAIA